MSQAAPIRIIGGGMTGLTLAYRLARQGHSVVLHEKDPYLGGLSGESSISGVPVERFYHCVLPTDTSLLSLLNEIGLSESVEWNRTRTGFSVNDRLLEMTTTADFLRFPALKLIDRIRLGWTVAYCGSRSDPSSFDGESVGPFLRRHGGERLFKSIWEPLLVAKLGSDYDRFAASFIWATIRRMLSARKAKGNSEKLGFVKGRYGQVFAALRRAIESAGGEVSVGVGVTGLSMPSSGEYSFDLTFEDGTERPAGGVVLCVPAPIAAGWVSSVAPGAAARLREVEYLGVICDCLLLKKPLSPYYVLNLTDRRLPFTGVIELTSLTGTREFGGRAVVYLPRYRSQNSEMWERTDNQVHGESLDGLSSIFPDFKNEDIEGWQVNRARYVQPVHPVGWASRIPPAHLAPGLAYVSTAQIYPWPVFNNEVINNVERNLAPVLNTLRMSRVSTVDVP